MNCHLFRPLKPSGAGCSLRSVFAVGLIALAAVIAGCGQKKQALPAQTSAFDSASPEIQAQWRKASSAAQTNGYEIAVLTLREMQARSDLTGEQRAAVDNLSTSVNDRLSEAAEKGDANAKQALEDIRQNWRNSQMRR